MDEIKFKVLRPLWHNGARAEPGAEVVTDNPAQALDLANSGRAVFLTEAGRQELHAALQKQLRKLFGPPRAQAQEPSPWRRLG